jgi:hypothetical protein
MALAAGYSNWFARALLGRHEGLEGSRAHDLQLRQLAQEQQYKSAAALARQHEGADGREAGRARG